MKLTEHFTLEEMTRSAKASAMGIANNPNEEQTENLKALCENVLEPLRNHLGRAVVINSGFRCRKLNDAVKGARNSQHMRGEAADIRVGSKKEVMEIMHFIMTECSFDQLIWEKSARSQWIHVSYSRTAKNRQYYLQKLRNG